MGIFQDIHEGDMGSKVADNLKKSFTPLEKALEQMPAIKHKIDNNSINIRDLAARISLTIDTLLTKVDRDALGDNVATLVGGKVPIHQLPAMAVVETFVIETKAALGSLSNAKRGARAIVTEDTDGQQNGEYVAKKDHPSHTDWVKVSSPCMVMSLNGKTGNVVIESIKESAANKHSIDLLYISQSSLVDNYSGIENEMADASDPQHFSIDKPFYAKYKHSLKEVRPSELMVRSVIEDLIKEKSGDLRADGSVQLHKSFVPRRPEDLVPLKHMIEAIKAGGMPGFRAVDGTSDAKAYTEAVLPLLVRDVQHPLTTQPAELTSYKLVKKMLRVITDDGMLDRGEITDIAGIAHTGIYEGEDVASSPVQGHILVTATKDKEDNFLYLLMGANLELYVGSRLVGSSSYKWDKMAGSSLLGSLQAFTAPSNLTESLFAIEKKIQDLIWQLRGAAPIETYFVILNMTKTDIIADCAGARANQNNKPSGPITDGAPHEVKFSDNGHHLPDSPQAVMVSDGTGGKDLKPLLTDEGEAVQSSTLKLWIKENAVVSIKKKGGVWLITEVQMPTARPFVRAIMNDGKAAFLSSYKPAKSTDAATVQYVKDSIKLSYLNRKTVVHAYADTPTKAELTDAFKLLMDYDWSKDNDFYLHDDPETKMLLVKYRSNGSTKESDTAYNFFYEKLEVAK